MYFIFYNYKQSFYLISIVSRIDRLRVERDKLITLNMIEEKILELQNCKRGFVKKVVSCDEESVAKLTWEEVLELLQAYW